MSGVGSARAPQWRSDQGRSAARGPAGSTGRQGEQGICGQDEFPKPGVRQSGLTVLPGFWTGEGRDESRRRKLGWGEPGPLSNSNRNRDTLIYPSTVPSILSDSCVFLDQRV